MICIILLILAILTACFPRTTLGAIYDKNGVKLADITKEDVEKNYSSNSGGVPAAVGVTYSQFGSVVLPPDVTRIGDCAFQAYGNLTSINIPNGVTEIGNSAFNRAGLTSIDLPASVKTLGVASFSFVNAQLTIPSTVTTIGANAFMNVPHVYYNGSATGSPWGALAIN